MLALSWMVALFILIFFVKENKVDIKCQMTNTIG